LPGLGEEGGGIGTEDARSGVVAEAWDSADVGAAFKDVDGGFIVSVDNEGGARAT